MTKIIKVTETHKFINLNADKTCKVISTRLNNGNLSVVFSGWNPFPCYRMETSWEVFTKWMEANGWIELAGFTRIITKEGKEMQ